MLDIRLDIRGSDTSLQKYTQNCIRETGTKWKTLTWV